MKNRDCKHGTSIITLNYKILVCLKIIIRKILQFAVIDNKISDIITNIIQIYNRYIQFITDIIAKLQRSVSAIKVRSQYDQHSFTLDNRFF